MGELFERRMSPRPEKMRRMTLRDKGGDPMGCELPALDISAQSHPKLYFFLRHHPEIMQVFHNIECDLDPCTGIAVADSDSSDIVKIYVDSLHIPILLEAKAIVRSESRQCAYAPLVSGLSFRQYDNVMCAKIAANRASAIASRAHHDDKKGDSLYCFYHGRGENPDVSAAFIEEVKELILKYCNNSAKDEVTSESSHVHFDFVFSAKIDR